MKRRFATASHAGKMARLSEPVTDFRSASTRSVSLLFDICSRGGFSELNVQVRSPLDPAARSLPLGQGWNELTTRELADALKKTDGGVVDVYASDWNPYHSWKYRTFDDGEVQTLLRVTKGALHVNVTSAAPVAFLRNPQLRIEHIECTLDSAYTGDAAQGTLKFLSNARQVKQLISALKRQPSLRSLCLHGPMLSEQDVAAICAACTSLEALEFRACDLPHQALPHLAALLRTSTTLRSLKVDEDDPANAVRHVFHGEHLPDFLAALKESKLEVFHAEACDIWASAKGLDLVNACVGHPTIKELNFSSNTSEELEMAERKAIGRVYASLVAAKQSALTSLSLYWNDIFDETLSIMTPFFKALGRNKTLQHLDLGLNGISLVRDFTPIINGALRCPSLRHLEVDLGDLDEAEDTSVYRDNEAALLEAIDTIANR
jgi:hypothetical protein